jgi:CheY-like chemotaxis protein
VRILSGFRSATRTGIDAVPKILVVDDNPDERQIYSALLYYNGFDVLEASSGDEAIRVAKAGLPDVVLVDYMMPIMSGLQVAETLRRIPETKDIPVVCMTAYDLTFEKAQAAGCRQLWYKPIPAGKLVVGLERLSPRPPHDGASPARHA